MNRKKSRLQLTYAALLLLLSVAGVSAYYDPGPQRWLNRDPLGNQGFAQIAHRAGAYDRNQYRFTVNSPLRWFDKFSLETADAMQSVGCFLCNVKATDAENAFRTAQSDADIVFPDNPGANEAFRHCEASAMVALSSGCGQSECLGDSRERFQTDFQHQSLRRMKQGLANNKIGRECAGCTGKSAGVDPVRVGLFPPSPPSFTDIANCCMQAIEDGKADLGDH